MSKNTNSARKHPSFSERRADTRAGAPPHPSRAPARGLVPAGVHFAALLEKVKP